MHLKYSSEGPLLDDVELTVLSKLIQLPSKDYKAFSFNILSISVHNIRTQAWFRIVLPTSTISHDPVTSIVVDSFLARNLDMLKMILWRRRAGWSGGSAGRGVGNGKHFDLAAYYTLHVRVIVLAPPAFVCHVWSEARIVVLQFLHPVSDALVWGFHSFHFPQMGARARTAPFLVRRKTTECGCFLRAWWWAMEAQCTAQCELDELHTCVVHRGARWAECRWSTTLTDLQVTQDLPVTCFLPLFSRDHGSTKRETLNELKARAGCVSSRDKEFACEDLDAQAVSTHPNKYIPEHHKTPRTKFEDRDTLVQNGGM
ncbi:hypothetical protein C8F04DRAFT_1198504 [Mycena alexandri]|uniref:Uncharacterized protein n=1 Tax=Mycena alexandri TaxID=1745969 RepID=A0AAD6S1V3_9AGAR|nr:hypothetical protein C8F04DRAFT_1198504 [Mycena alexandri]